MGLSKFLTDPVLVEVNELFQVVVGCGYYVSSANNCFRMLVRQLDFPQVKNVTGLTQEH